MIEEEMIEIEDFDETEELELSSDVGVEEIDGDFDESADDLSDLTSDAMDAAADKVDFSDASQLDFSDVEDDVECPFSIELRCRVIEAVLFVSDKPVGVSTLVASFGDEENMRKAHVREALDALQEELIESDRGFRLHQVDGGYQLRTAVDLKDFLQNTIKARSFRLTGPSLETLAMVAYKQPCTKSQIDEIRGVESSHLVRALMDRNLLSFAGKSELPGKPMLYKTTSKFLEVFGLRNIRELPSLSEIEALLPNGIGEEEEEKETLSDLAGKLTEDYDGSYSASEEELGKINDQLSSISTETEFFEQEKQREKDRKEKEKAEDIREALMVGEEVSARDQNWLVRYDEALTAASAEGEPVVEEGDISEELSALSDDSETPIITEESDSDEEVLMATDAAPEVEEVTDAEMIDDGLSEDDLAEIEAQKLIQASQSEGGESEVFDEGFDEADTEVTLKTDSDELES